MADKRRDFFIRPVSGRTPSVVTMGMRLGAADFAVTTHNILEERISFGATAELFGPIAPMPYFADFTPYRFLRGSKEKNVFNIGWLGRWHSYKRGPVDGRLFETLLRLCREPVNRTRGWQQCPFCAVHPVLMSVGGENVALGDAEIRVAGENGKVYAAPTLICHYIAEHGYCPPQEFLDAVAILAN